MNSLLACLLASFLISFAAIPSIIRIAGHIHLYDEPSGRKQHARKVPLLGGVAILASTLFSFTVWAAPYFEQIHLPIIASLLIIFFFGLRDDIEPFSPLKKISGQVVAAFILIAFSDIRLKGLHGLFGVHTLSIPVSYSLSILTVLFIINAYNLIDGIDGLAGGLGTIASGAFGILFLHYHDLLMAVLSFSLCGALMGFLPYNFRRARIFLGDTGSMTAGFIFAILSLHFMELTRTAFSEAWFDYYHAPVVILAILAIPLTDAVRIMFFRLLRFKSPFKADRKHIHHQLLALGLTPLMVSSLLCLVNLFLIIVAWLLRDAGATFAFYLLVCVSFAILLLPDMLLRIKKSLHFAWQRNPSGNNKV